MENSMALLSATMQQNALVMANTMHEGFAARPSLEGNPHTLTKKRARTSSQVARDDSSGSSHKKSRTMVREARTAQVVVASPHQSKREEEDEVSLLDPADSFSDPEQAEAAVTTISTLDMATTDFDVEETTGPPLSEAMAQRVDHIIKTELQPEKLKLRLDRELCPGNAPSISAKKGYPLPF